MSDIKRYPKIIVKKSNTGKGIFALEEIKKGTKILQYIGNRLTTEEADRKPNRYIFEIDDKWSIDGSPMWNTARYFNHSCKGNAESIMEGDDRIFIAAKKKILPGEEITFNYGKEYTNMYFKKGGCKCYVCTQVS
jgi:SET domain-containing protein